VTGSRGQLGRALERAAADAGHDFIGVDLPDVDITDASAVDEAVTSLRPAVIVNCAAFTAVDLAEEREPAALRVNGEAVGVLARASHRVGATLVQLSTDYVFDGLAGRPYREEDPVNPRSAYGRTKLAGELAAQSAYRHLVIRTAWLFGEGANFVRAILRQIEDGARQLRVVNDQHGSPTCADDLAVALLGLLHVEAEGIVHAVNDGAATWWGLAREIVAATGADVEVVPVATSEMPRPARRPAYSVLSCARLAALLGRPLQPWQDALGRYIASGRARG